MTKQTYTPSLNNDSNKSTVNTFETTEKFFNGLDIRY